MSAAPQTDPTVSPRPGILPADEIRGLWDAGVIFAQSPPAENQIQPASIDLRLGETAYRVRASFLPGPGQPVATKLESLKLHEIDLRNGAVLETGCVYLVPLLEKLALPQDLAAAANPKSSTGRLDVFTRVITDGAREFDQIAPGYHGTLYAEISPRTFSILVRTGSRLSQLRLRRGNVGVSAADMLTLQAETGLVLGGGSGDDEMMNDARGITLSVDLRGEAGTGLIGYRAKRHSGLIDVDRTNAYDALDFWDPVTVRGDARIILDPDEFYILASREAVQIPPDYAAEMVPYDPLVGEFRVHYAGFFDPGFGAAEANGAGARAVLEVRSHEVPFILEHGQIIGRLVYEHMASRPGELYGQSLGSNYQRQGLKLSKHFKSQERAG
ncbi:2'-deoxycytidine 5'-triphosphate deaminase [Pyruvatibacter sp.]|uniref:2'-deoxycytidine 5'-triphosphate deaminase n=1 Tax=Pyruvatibacter sp. TaxID=1981328 RepID=UPI0032F043BC